MEAGCDEAGRGPLAGPVYAAAVVLPSDFSHPLLNDSKKLTGKQRLEIREFIVSHARDYGIARVDNQEIDELNIFRSAILAMHRAIDQLRQTPEHLIIDGKYFTPYQAVPHQCVVKGDGRYMPIAAASVLAKTARDEHMMELHQHYPVYNWLQNKGYPTPQHREAIRRHGPTPYHRRSFKLLPDARQMRLDNTR